MIVAEFAGEAELMRAAARLRAEKIGHVETYTPTEPEEQELSDRRGSRIPLGVLIIGVLAALGMFLLQSYATTISYPLDIGGRPDFSWPAYVPNAFEVGVLASILSGFAGFLFANRMPSLHRRIDEARNFRRASIDGHFLAIVGADEEHARRLLAGLGPETVEEVPE